MLATARRAPPRGNPDPQVPQTYAQPTAVAIPWGQIILTTAITTVTGYVVIELIRLLHQSVVRRRRAKADGDLTALAPASNVSMGYQQNGSFVMPRPQHFGMGPMMGPPGVAPSNPFPSAANANTYQQPAPPRPPQQPQPQQPPPPPQQPPHLYDVAAPVGRHEFYSHTRQIDDRLARMEAMLSRQYEDDEEVA